MTLITSMTIVITIYMVSVYKVMFDTSKNSEQTLVAC